MTDSAGGDAELIAASLAEPERFAVLFERHAPAIHQYVARRLGRDAADDVTAETFLTAFRIRARYAYLGETLNDGEMVSARAAWGVVKSPAPAPEHRERRPMRHWAPLAGCRSWRDRIGGSVPIELEWWRCCAGSTIRSGWSGRSTTTVPRPRPCSAGW